MKKGFFMSIMITVSCLLFAQNRVSKELASNVANNVFQQIELYAKKKISIDSVFFLTNDKGDTIMSEFVSDKGYYVLLSGNMNFFPVLSIGNRPSMRPTWSDTNAMPPALSVVFDEYKRQIDQCFTDSVSSLYNAEWMRFSNADGKTQGSRYEGVLPMISSMWGQRESNDGGDACAYNYHVAEHCPATGECCPAGCAAVAMGQILNYWKYPVYLANKTYGFDWCNMTNYLVSTSCEYNKKRDAVANLLEKCGESLNMVYCDGNCNVSNANVNDYESAFGSYLYNQSVRYCNLVDDTMSERKFVRILKRNMDNGMPVILKGCSWPYGGTCHSFICDGYIELDGGFADDLYHINWGWNGNYDAYYYLNHLYNDDFSCNTSIGMVHDIHPNVDTIPSYEYDLSLKIHYNNYYYYFGKTTPHPYENVPSTSMNLTSVPESYPDSLRTIPTGASSMYKAHQSITLVPGFHAEWGSDFTAIVDPCMSCNESTMLEIETLTEENTTDTIGTEENSERMLLRHSDSTYLIEPSQVRLYPNPTTGKLTVEGLSGATNIQLFDVKGMSVFRWYVESRSEEGFVLNVSALRQGTISSES